MPGQAAFIKNPKKAIGTTVRTEFDGVQLRGKGFIYISPENGPYALSGPGPFGAIIENRWGFAGGKLLELALIHELGHVFGIRHVDATVMDPFLLRLLISQPFGSHVMNVKENPAFFVRDGGPDRSYFGASRAWEDDVQTLMLGIPASYKWFEIRPDSAGVLKLLGSSSPSEEVLAIGRFIPELANGSYFVSEESPLVNLFLTKDQRVFPLIIDRDGSASELFYPTDLRVNYRYVQSDIDVGKSVSMAVGQLGISLTAAGIGGRIVDDFMSMSDLVVDNAGPMVTPVDVIPHVLRKFLGLR